MWLPVLVFVAGVACIVVAAASGNAEVQLLVIFPLVSGSGWLFILGIVLIIASFILGFVLAASSMEEPPSPVETPSQRKTGTQKRYGGVVIIGPVPIIFGSDRKMAFLMLVVAIVIIAVILAIALLTL